ncbi:hypothetical protein EIN_472520, partial [Entamoeba invadens IP1]
MQNGQSFPVFYCLMTAKNLKSYTFLFNKIEEICESQIFHENKIVMGDFEIVFFKQIFVNDTILKNCHFHFRQSIFRRVLALGFSDRYKDGDIFKMEVKML